MTPTTRRYPRTLQEAFGPYEAGPVLPPLEPQSTHLAEWVILGLAILFFAGLAFGWFNS